MKVACTVWDGGKGIETGFFSVSALPIVIVYGIAITAMSFFTDPTISTLTSGTLSQTVDLAGYSFPRRIGVRFHPDYIAKNHYVGLQCKWEAFKDDMFTESLGKLFQHSDIISREGWARYYFDGKFESDVAYVRLKLLNASTGVLVHTYYFKFHKEYQTSLDGRTYVKDPILHTKIVKNGTLTEMLLKGGKYVAGSTNFIRTRLNPEEDADGSLAYQMMDEKISCITMTYVRYTEKPKMTFLVTPPHLPKYAKLLLILIKQLVDLNFSQSYATKENQKPLYKTRFMLDELGNLQSEGHGIAGFETMLSIGLGQEQQFTLILQTLQQLKDVYGDSVDKIVQGNAQPLNSKVLTPGGFIEMGNIVQGNEVVTPDGNISKVTGVYPRGIRKVYCIKRRNGSKTRACNEHLWKVQLSDEDATKWNTICCTEGIKMIS